MNSKVPFSERHPKLNFTIGLIFVIILLAVSVFIVIVFIRLIGYSFNKALLFLKDAVSKLDAVIIVALITGGVSITGVVLSSIISKVLEYKQKRREYLYQKREKPYEDFIELIYKVQELNAEGKIYPKKKIISDTMVFSQELTLWGSNRVIKKWLKFKNKTPNSENPTDSLFDLEEIMFAMRKDMGLNKLGKGKLLSFFVTDIEKYKSSNQN